MSIDEQLEALVRRAVREELAENRELLREELQALLSRSAHASLPSPTRRTAEDEVDTKAAAALAHVKPRTINEWKRRGWLTPVKRGKSHVYRVGDVLAVARDRGAPRKILDYEAEARRILAQKGRTA